MPDFPLIATAPSSRSFEMGDWPVKTFKAQNGAELRILYGNRRTNMTLNLEWRNLTYNNVQQIMQHYIDSHGSWTSFLLPNNNLSGQRVAWSDVALSGNAIDQLIGVGENGNRWRYAEPPSIQSVQKNRHNVSIKLIGVT